MAAESKLEEALRTEAEDRGFLFLKFTSPGLRGVPDRIVLGPNGKVVFMELKAPNGTLGPNQLRIHKLLKSMGHTVVTVWSREQGRQILESI